MRRPLLLLCVWGCVGCAYRVQLSAVPAGAEVELPRGKGTVVTPEEVVFRWLPFGHEPIRVSAPGYRTAELDLRDHEIKLSRYVSDTLWHPATLFGKPRGEVRVILVPDHGPVGTWGVDEVP